MLFMLCPFLNISDVYTLQPSVQIAGADGAVYAVQVITSSKTALIILSKDIFFKTSSNVNV